MGLRVKAIEEKSIPQQRLAVLIDADNTSPQIVEPLFAEIAKYGTASVKRIYGDWTSPNLKGWKEVLLSHAIQPIQQFRYTVGKNATDSAMIIDAMDLLYTNRFDGFCIVSSDSDFTRLASRLRESGVTVYGFGEKKTPSSFVSACDKFIYTEILREPVEGSSATVAKTNGQARSPRASLKNDRKLLRILTEAVDAVADEDGWAHLGNVGQKISNQYPSFDARNYGFQKLGELIRAVDAFKIDERVVDSYGHKAIYVKKKERRRRRPAKTAAKKE